MELVDVVDSKSTASDGVPVRVRPPAPYHLNTLDQLAKSPVVSRCSGFFTVGNFLKTPWINGRFAEVQTGFEPLFFHIQAEFQWQRPFSEGCSGWISEKSEKNLSQSYGRWIVGFHEPSPVPFLHSKRALRTEVYCMCEENTSQKERFLQEVEQKLLHRELDARLLEDGLLHVSWNEKPLCSVDGNGTVRFRPADITEPNVDQQLRAVTQTISQKHRRNPAKRLRR